MSTHSPEATQDDSTTPPASRGFSALFGLALAGAVLLVVATFAPVIEIVVLTVERASFSGFDRHGVAFIVIAVFAVPMALGALRGALPAQAALAALGVAVLLIAAITDLPHLDDAGVWPESDAYEDARARAGAGWYLETAGGVALLVAGGGMLLSRRGGAGGRAQQR